MNELPDCMLSAERGTIAELFADVHGCSPRACFLVSLSTVDRSVLSKVVGVATSVATL